MRDSCQCCALLIHIYYISVAPESAQQTHVALTLHIWQPFSWRLQFPSFPNQGTPQFAGNSYSSSSSPSRSSSSSYCRSPDNRCKYFTWHFRTGPVFIFLIIANVFSKSFHPLKVYGPSARGSSFPIFIYFHTSYYPSCQSFDYVSKATVASHSIFSIVIQLFPITTIQSFIQK